MAKQFEVLEQRWEKLFEQAQEQIQEDNLDAAEHSLAQCRAIALEMGPEGARCLGMTLNMLASVLTGQGNLEKALKASQHAYELLENSDQIDAVDKAGLARNVANLHLQMQSTDLAVEWYKKSIDILKGADEEDAEEAVGEIGYSYVMMARALGDKPDSTDEVTEQIKLGLAEASKDKHGDGYFRVAGLAARILMELDMTEEAIVVLTQALEVLKGIYSIPVGDEKKSNPGWVFDIDLARSIVFRENFQQDGLEPMTMTEIRYMLATIFLNEERMDDAIAQFSQVEATLELERKHAEKDGFDDEDEDEDDEQFLDDDEEEDEDDDEEGDDDFGDDDDDEDDDEEEDDMPGGYYIDRAQFFNHYGCALHLKGQQTHDRSLLEKAKAAYTQAFEFLEEAEDREELQSQLTANLEEVDGDLGRIK